MRKQRAESLEIDDSGSHGKVVKIAVMGFAGMMLAGGVLCGSVYLMSRPAGDPGWNLPSLQGLMISASTGGKVNARQFDNLMEGVCSNMASVGSMVRGGEADSASMAANKRAQRACRNGKFEKSGTF
jgi:hypothetical protein